jgi:uncharacterized membrane protein
MENKKVGLLIMGIGFLALAMSLIFNITLKKITNESCSHGSSCSMYSTMNFQLWLSIAIVGLIFVIGLFVMFSKPREKIVVKTIKEKIEKRKIDLSKLEKDEKEAIKILMYEGNAMFQKDLMEKLNIGKVGMTRLLDKLEAKQLIIRKRRGMNNVVVLKS